MVLPVPQAQRLQQAKAANRLSSCNNPPSLPLSLYIYIYKYADIHVYMHICIYINIHTCSYEVRDGNNIIVRSLQRLLKKDHRQVIVIRVDNPEGPSTYI